MVKYTIVDYWIYQTKVLKKHSLSDVKTEYQLTKKTKNQKKKTHQYHDKIFKKILDNKKEFINFIKKYTEYEQEGNLIKESDIEKYNRKFITNNFYIK